MIAPAGYILTQRREASAGSVLLCSWQADANGVAAAELGILDCTLTTFDSVYVASGAAPATYSIEVLDPYDVNVLPLASALDPAVPQYVAVFKSLGSERTARIELMGRYMMRVTGAANDAGLVKLYYQCRRSNGRRV